MEAYLQAFINFEQNDWAKLLPIVEFAYNNAKNLNTGYMPFELNRGYYPCVFFEKVTNPCLQSKLVDKLATKLRDLITVCRENFYHAQKLQKQAHNKGVKLRSYASNDKVWLNSKYIKTKRNWKFEVQFFGLFRLLHLVGKQAYKLELPKHWRMHNVFHVSLLDEDTTKKEWVDKRVKELELEAGDSKEYKIEAIWDSAVYISE